MSIIAKLLIFSVFLALAISIETTSEVNSSCSGIDHCLTCHSGNIWYVCDQCDPNYGVDTKYDGSDLCIYCDSAIPHCLECSNPEDAWNCGQCAPGYRLVTIQFQNDMCVQDTEATTQFLA